MGILERAADLAELGRVGQREAQLFPRNRSFPEALAKIAVLIPCYNEELTIGAVVRDFRAALPGAEIFVYDNNSRDGTSAAARAAGVEPRREPLAGKGNVVRRMFADVEADVYVLVHGDATHHAPKRARDGPPPLFRATRHGRGPTPPRRRRGRLSRRP